MTCVVEDLRLKDAQCEKLQMVQVKMGEELEELTASLFEVGRRGVLCKLGTASISYSYFLYSGHDRSLTEALVEFPQNPVLIATSFFTLLFLLRPSYLVH